MVRETGCDGVAIGRGCQAGRGCSPTSKTPRGHPERLNPNLGEVCRVIHRHAELLTEFMRAMR